MNWFSRGDGRKVDRDEADREVIVVMFQIIAYIIFQLARGLA